MSLDQITLGVLEEVFAVNNLFTEGKGDEFYQAYANEQDPKVTLVTCSDSRVHLNAFSNIPQNTFFVIRNIGNQIQSNLGSVDYGVKVIKTPLLFIIGHANCGAVEAHRKNLKPGPEISKEITDLRSSGKTLKEGVLNNIDYQVIFAIKRYKKLVKTNQLKVLGFYYDFNNDFGLGHGKIILVNMNGQVNEEFLSQHLNNVSNLNTL